MAEPLQYGLIIRCLFTLCSYMILFYHCQERTAKPPSESRGRTGKHLYRPPLQI